MEPEGTLLHSQLPATCLYPEPARSSPYPHLPLPENPSSHLRQGLPTGLISSGFPTKPCTRHSYPPLALHAPPISFFSILSP